MPRDELKGANEGGAKEGESERAQGPPRRPLVGGRRREAARARGGGRGRKGQLPLCTSSPRTAAWPPCASASSSSTRTATHRAHQQPASSAPAMAAARGDYTRVPVEEGVELKNAHQRSQSPQPRAPAPRQGEEPPASRAMVVFSVGFYLVAAIVVRPLSLPLPSTWSCAPRRCELELARCTCHGRVLASGGARLGRRARAGGSHGSNIG